MTYAYNAKDLHEQLIKEQRKEAERLRLQQLTEEAKTAYFARVNSKSDNSWVLVHEKPLEDPAPDPKVVLDKTKAVSPYVAGLLSKASAEIDWNRYDTPEEQAGVYRGFLKELIEQDTIRIYNVIGNQGYDRLTNPERYVGYGTDEAMASLPKLESPYGPESGDVSKTMLEMQAYAEQIGNLSHYKTLHGVRKTAEILGYISVGLVAAGGIVALFCPPAGAAISALGGGVGLSSGLVSLGAEALEWGASQEIKLAGEEIDLVKKVYLKNAGQWHKEGEGLWGEETSKQGGRWRLKIDNAALDEREMEIELLMPKILQESLGRLEGASSASDLLKQKEQPRDRNNMYYAVDMLGKILFGQPNPAILAYDLMMDRFPADSYPVEMVDAINKYVDQSYWRMVPSKSAADYWAAILGTDYGTVQKEMGNERAVKFKEGAALENEWISKLQLLLGDMVNRGVNAGDEWQQLLQDKKAAESRRHYEQFFSPDRTRVPQIPLGILNFNEELPEPLQTPTSIGGDGQAMPYVRQLADEGVGGIDLSAMQVSYSADTAGPPPILGTPGGPAAPAPAGPGGGGYAAAASSAPGGPKVQSQDIASQLKAPLIQETQLARVPDTDRYFEPPADTAAAGSYSPGVPGGFSLAAGGPGYGAYGQQGMTPQIVYRFDPGSIIIKKQDINEQQAEKLVTAVLQKHSRVAGPAPATATA